MHAEIHAGLIGLSKNTGGACICGKGCQLVLLPVESSQPGGQRQRQTHIQNSSLITCARWM